MLDRPGRLDRLPLGALALPRDKVDVWCVSLQDSELDLEHLRTILSLDEASRADRFYRRVDRELFIARRALLRQILGCYLRTEPASLRFLYGAHGKPALTARQGDPSVSFNLSHSRALVLYAIAVGRRVGIDVEYIDDSSKHSEVSMLLSARENGALLALPPAQRRAAFFRCWTRKEAYVKATGRGLAQPLHDFEVSVAPDEPARLVSVREDSEAARRWTLCDLHVPSGYAAALAVEGHGGQLACRLWPPKAFAGVEAS